MTFQEDVKSFIDTLNLDLREKALAVTVAEAVIEQTCKQAELLTSFGVNNRQINQAALFLY